MSQSNAMPPNIEELFNPINNDVTWLHTIWELYLQLYGSSEESIDIMNSSAPHFFSILQNVLFEELILIVGRLIESPSTFGRQNASIERLIDEIAAENFPTLASSLKKRLVDFRVQHASFKTWRNRRVGHNDMLAVTDEPNNPMPGMPRNQVQAAIDELAGIMNEVSEQLLGSTQKYMPFLVAQGDGTALLEVLKRGTLADTSHGA